MNTQPTPATAHIIIADGTFDQVCEDTTTAKQECKDLREMGHIVRVIKCPWQDQDDVVDQYS